MNTLGSTGHNAVRRYFKEPPSSKVPDDFNMFGRVIAVPQIKIPTMPLDEREIRRRIVHAERLAKMESGNYYGRR